MNPFHSSPRDWAEDATQENGNYQCRCITCKQSFTGHKRRNICKECAEKNSAQETSIVMGYDAMRICLGHEPKSHTVDEVIRWMQHVGNSGKSMVARSVLELCRDALAKCYDVTEWPADGTGPQAEALKAANQELERSWG